MSTINTQPLRGFPEGFRSLTESVKAITASFDGVMNGSRFLSDNEEFSFVNLPILERKELYEALGRTSDVVSREMFSFQDRGGREVVLRPEFTASMARAYINGSAPRRAYTFGPCFRYERPQEGRYRQFTQIGVEAFFPDSFNRHVANEMLVKAFLFLIWLGIPREFLDVRVNSIGSLETRRKWKRALVSYFENNRSQLADLDVERINRNVFRILDSKEEKTKVLLSEGEFPTSLDFLTRDEKLEYLDFRKSLERRDPAALVRPDPSLIRGLDYYNDRVFEITTPLLGAQNTLIGGGQYDTLVETLGGPPTKAFGWAGGVERIALTLEKVRRLQSS